MGVAALVEDDGGDDGDEGGKREMVGGRACWNLTAADLEREDG